jgi:hypothetical protein
MLLSGLPSPVVPGPRAGTSYTLPWNSSGFSRARIWRMIWMYSRVRVSGFP